VYERTGTQERERETRKRERKKRRKKEIHPKPVEKERHTARPHTRHASRRLALPPPLPLRFLSPTPVDKLCFPLQLKFTSLRKREKRENKREKGERERESARASTAITERGKHVHVWGPKRGYRKHAAAYHHISITVVTRPQQRETIWKR